MLDTLLPLLQLLLPLVFLLGALPGANRWHRAMLVNGATGAAVLVVAVMVPSLTAAGLIAISDETIARGPTAAGQAITVVVGLLGMVIARFSRNYLRGEPDRERFLTQLQITLSGVACVLVTDHLLIFLLGWVIISLSLHRLLLFYPNRTRAVLAAHKKFLLARAAEFLLLVAIVLLYQEFNTFQLSEIRAALAKTAPGPSAHAAAILIAAVALIKCAQLPVHGWLIQVVEAPTPVSALLHAGVINLGGYLLMSFGPLLSQVPAAQWLVLLVAGATLVLSALVMGLQTSIKVRLAWSTSAQMGLMLVQCALGLYTLALLHLLAHACYKAYTFLSSGAAVDLATLRRMAPRPRKSVGALVSAVAASGTAVLAVALLLGPGGVLSPWLLLFALLTVVVFERGAQGDGFPQLSSLALAGVLMAAYVGQKLAMTALMPGFNGAVPAGADLWLSALILLMATAFWLLRERQQLPVVRRAGALLFAGLYLDEWFTRVTLEIWPLRLPSRPHAKQLPASESEVV